MKNWFLAKLVFQPKSEAANHKTQFHEELRLFAAIDEADAFEKAEKLGLSEEETFINYQDISVQWSFIGITELIPIELPAEGSPIYTNTVEADDDSFLLSIQRRVSHLRQKVRLEPAAL